MEEWDGKIIVGAYGNHVFNHQVNVMEYVKRQYKELSSPMIRNLSLDKYPVKDRYNEKGWLDLKRH